MTTSDARAPESQLHFADGEPGVDSSADTASADTLPVDIGDLGPAPCGPSTCGNGCCAGGACHPGNTPTACGTGGGACQDCSAKGEVCKVGSCGPCEKSADCAGDTVCLKDPVDAPTGTCVDAWNRTWYILVVSGVINCNQGWDLTSDPDPYVTIHVGTAASYTKTQYDECDPVWKQFVEPKLHKTTPVVLEVRDDDGVLGDQLIGKVEYKTGIPINLLKQDTITYKAASASAGLQELVVVVRPLP